MSVIFAGVLEHRPNLKMVIGEAGTGWIPYILDRMDAEWGTSSRTSTSR